MSRPKNNKYKNFIAIFIFGIAFGFVEAAVVYYLRHLLRISTNYNIKSYHTLLNLGFIAFIKPTRPVLILSSISRVEFIREASTIIMLLTLSYLSADKLKHRVGAFLISFACWDIFYYIFLKMLTGWPAGFFTKDIFFLIPVPWIGPIITPIVISSLMLILGSIIYLDLFNKKIKSS